MRRYETIFILRPSLNEEEINTVVERASDIITGNDGTIIDLDRWGMKKLAYQIKKESQGFYVYCDFAGTPEAIAEMERRFRIDDAVLRYLTVKTAEVISEEEIAQATAQVASRQAEEEAETEEEGEAAAEDAKPASQEKTATPAPQATDKE